MTKIYLVVKGTFAAIITMRSPNDLKADFWGGGYDLYEIGVANRDTPPGCAIMAANDAEVCQWRPLGVKIERSPLSEASRSTPDPAPNH